MASPTCSTIALRAESYLRPLAATHQMSGAVALIKKGQLCYAKAFGYADYSLKRPNTLTTKFLLASISKQFTAAAILLLEQRGQLRASDRLVDILPDYPTGGGHDAITIDQLVHHKSGLPAQPQANDEFPSEYLPIAHDDLLRISAERPLLYPPGEGYEYSNPGYQALARVVEVVSGMPYRTFVRTQLLEPLGMYDTGFALTQPVAGQAYPAFILASGQVVNSVYKPYAENPPFTLFAPRPVRHPSWTEGSGGMYSTLEDLHKWHVGMLGDRIFDAAHRAKRLKAQDYGYAYGVIVSPLRVNHDGHHPWGTRTSLSRYADGSELIFLVNTENARIIRDTPLSGLIETPEAKELERMMFTP